MGRGSTKILARSLAPGAGGKSGARSGVLRLKCEHTAKVCYRMSMKPGREGLVTTAIIAAGGLLILIGILVWALLFFRNIL